MGYRIRKIDFDDYHKGYFSLLSNLSISIRPSLKDWENRYYRIKQNNNHFIFVVEDQKKIIGSITMLIEPKFIRNLSNVGHIEDVVVDPGYKGKGIGTQLIKHCIDLAKTHDCYKVILNCTEELGKFYEQFGFQDKGKEMSIYFRW